jgi:hypothetical protein
MDKIRVLNSLTNIRKDLAEARGYDYSGVEVLEYVIEKIDSGEWTEHLPKEKEVEDKTITRAEILDAAKKCVCGQREQDYGTPESNFQLIADLWTDYLGRLISPTDVSMMMALLKIARIKNGGGTGDSFVDLAGYAACGDELNSLSKDVPENDDILKPEDKTGLFSDAFEDDNRLRHFCNNCKYEYEVSDGEHCNHCCHNNVSSKISNWEKVDVPKECSNCLYKDKSEDEHPCNKCVMNGHDQYRWVSDGDKK